MNRDVLPIIPRNCTECHLHENRTHVVTPLIQLKHNGILFIGQSPGFEEDKVGIPFVGKSGKFFKHQLLTLGINPYECQIINAVNCIPLVKNQATNKTKDRAPTKKELTACFKYIERSIDQTRPKVIVCLGKVAANQLAGEELVRSQPIWSKKYNAYVIYTVHPAHIMRSPNQLRFFMNDLKTVQSILKDEYTLEIDYGDVVMVKSEKMLDDMLERIYEAGEVAFDTETTGLNFNKHINILCFSFACDERLGYVVPYEHPLYKIEPHFKDYIQKKIYALLSDRNVRKIGHNIKYDMKIAYINNFTLLSNCSYDTMLANYAFISEEPPHGLKQLAFTVKMGGYEDSLAKTKTDLKITKNDDGFSKIPMNILYPYAGRDAICTFRLYKKYSQIEDRKSQYVFDEILMPLNNVLTRMELTGVKIDLRKLIELRDKYEEIITDILKRMKETTPFRKAEEFYKCSHILKDIFKVSSIPQIKSLSSITKPQLLWLTYIFIRETELMKMNMPKSIAFVPPAYMEEIITKYILYIAEEYNRRQGLPQKDGFKLSSDIDVRFLLYDAIGATPSNYTNGGDLSTDRETIEKILSEDNVSEENAKALNTLKEYREYDKIYNTYIKGIIKRLDTEQILRTNFKPLTVTGRLSSENPNLQNIPSEYKGDIGKEIKGLFIPRSERKVYVLSDFGQVELRILACYSKDKYMTQLLSNTKLDMHAIVAAEIFHPKVMKNTEVIRVMKRDGGLFDIHYNQKVGYPNNKGEFKTEVGVITVNKKQRHIAKTVNFGIPYGRSAQGIADSPDINMSVEEAEKLMGFWFDRFYETRDWIDSIKTEIIKQGHINTFFGRYRRFESLKLLKGMLLDGKFNEEYFIKKIQSDDVLNPMLSAYLKELREIVNFPIQSTASDITLLSLIEVSKHIKKHKLPASIILTVHDMIGVECDAGIADKFMKDMKHIMENIGKIRNLSWLTINLPVDIAISEKWE